MRTSVDVEIVVEIARPPEEVWAFVSDAERLPEWLEEFRAVTKESGGPVGKGSVFRYTLEPGDRSGTAEWAEWDPGKRLAWDGPPLKRRGGGVRSRGSFEVIPSGPTRTRFVARYRPELTGTAMLLRPVLLRWLRRQRREDSQRLKELLEASPNSH
jgi:uncharacterized protein YndB with AHSA1/START domain